jgi:hypothetical protein
MHKASLARWSCWPQLRQVFDQYDSFETRGEDFIAQVAALKAT